MTSLPDFERDAREAMVDTAENALYAERDNLAFALLQAINQNFEDYAATQGYDLDSIIESGQVTDTQRTRRGARATLRWGSLSALFEFGVDPHTITGNPTLAFQWPAPPEGTRPEGAPGYVVADEVEWGSVTGGIPESRAVRGALNQLRFERSGSIRL